MSDRVDRLSALLQRFELHARVFHSGALCGVADFDAREGVGHLHLVRRGPVGVTDRRGRRTEVVAPCALFYPRPATHRLDADEREGADVVCASIEFGPGDENPLLRSLPELLVIPLAEQPALAATQELLFTEAVGQRCGHAAVVDRLTEVLVVQLLRFAIERRLVDGGLMAGLADPRLAKALNAVHAEPGRAWSLEALAQEAGMSRSRFAARFSAVLGLPPMAYLTQWRVGVAKGMLRKGRPVKQVATELGYSRASAFGRVFGQTVGLTPLAWVRSAGS